MKSPGDKSLIRLKLSAAGDGICKFLWLQFTQNDPNAIQKLVGQTRKPRGTDQEHMTDTTRQHRL